MPAILACFLLSLAPVSAGQQIDIRWVYVSDHLVWEAPPKDPELPKYRTSHARFAIFYPSGEFGGGFFTIGRYGKKGALFIIPGEGFEVWRGTWKRNSDGSITVTSKIVYEEMMVPVTKKGGQGPVKEELPGLLEETHWFPQGKSGGRLAAILRSTNEEYKPLNAMSDLGTLNRLINLSPKNVR